MEPTAVLKVPVAFFFRALLVACTADLMGLNGFRCRGRINVLVVPSGASVLALLILPASEMEVFIDLVVGTFALRRILPTAFEVYGDFLTTASITSDSCILFSAARSASAFLLSASRSRSARFCSASLRRCSAACSFSFLAEMVSEARHWSCQSHDH